MPEPTSPKLEKLFKMLEREPGDAFLLYGVAMEYRKLEDPSRALEYFGKVISVDPNYCYAYYQRGQVHEDLGQTDAAKTAYQEGLVAARRAGDAHALSEIQGALDMLG